MFVDLAKHPINKPLKTHETIVKPVMLTYQAHYERGKYVVTTLTITPIIESEDNENDQ